MEASAVEFSRTFLSRSTPAPLPTDPIRQYSPILIFQSPTCRIGIDQRTPSRHKPRRSIQPLRNRTNQINKQTNKQREIGKSLCVGASKQTATPSSERGAEHLPPFSSSHPPSPSLSLSLFLPLMIITQLPMLMTRRLFSGGDQGHVTIQLCLFLETFP